MIILDGFHACSFNDCQYTVTVVIFTKYIESNWTSVWLPAIYSWLRFPKPHLDICSIFIIVMLSPPFLLGGHQSFFLPWRCGQINRIELIASIHLLCWVRKGLRAKVTAVSNSSNQSIVRLLSKHYSIISATHSQTVSKPDQIINASWMHPEISHPFGQLVRPVLSVPV